MHLRDDRGSVTQDDARGAGGAVRLPAPAAGDECLNVDLARNVEPMLAAVVRLSGATAATLRLVAADGSVGPPIAAAGPPETRSPWCTICDEDLDADSECVARQVCGHADGVVTTAVTQVCRHVATIPLEHRGRAVGTLGLMFREPCRIAPELAPMLKAAGDLLGVTMENARLAAENLRMSLVSERQMMANEVHDSLAQALTYMRMRMSLLADAVRQGDQVGAHKYWADVDDSLTNAHRRLRELITYFRSRMDPQGLVHALRETAATFASRTGVSMKLDNCVPGFCLPADREVEIYHIVQEALANVCRHAQARHVEVRLDGASGGRGYEITVADDGVGVPVEATEADDGGHYGIAIMRERARRLGGVVTLERVRGGGTCVRLAIPVVPVAPANESWGRGAAGVDK